MADPRGVLALPFSTGSDAEAEVQAAAAACRGTSEPRRPMAASSESEAIRGALAGDGGCWSRLIERHNHRVVVSLLGRGVPLDSAKDLAQETWLRLIESQRAGRLLALSLPGLAIVQAGFLAATARRNGHHGSQQDSAPPPTEPLCVDNPADEQMIKKEELHRIAHALDGLSAAARRVFRFVYEHPELSYAEAATELGLSTQRVKQTMCEVRKVLRTALTDEAS